MPRSNTSCHISASKSNPTVLDHPHTPTYFPRSSLLYIERRTLESTSRAPETRHTPFLDPVRVDNDLCKCHRFDLALTPDSVCLTLKFTRQLASMAFHFGQKGGHVQKIRQQVINDSPSRALTSATPSNFAFGNPTRDASVLGPRVLVCACWICFKRVFGRVMK